MSMVGHVRARVARRGRTPRSPPNSRRREPAVRRPWPRRAPITQTSEGTETISWPRPSLAGTSRVSPRSQLELAQVDLHLTDSELVAVGRDVVDRDGRVGPLPDAAVEADVGGGDGARGERQQQGQAEQPRSRAPERVADERDPAQARLRARSRSRRRFRRCPWPRRTRPTPAIATAKQKCAERQQDDREQPHDPLPRFRRRPGSRTSRVAGSRRRGLRPHGEPARSTLTPTARRARCRPATRRARRGRPARRRRPGPSSQKRAEAERPEAVSPNPKNGPGRMARAAMAKSTIAQTGGLPETGLPLPSSSGTTTAMTR